ncbi:MAG: isopentenyl phosphate kinase [Anaerolineales bacterium]
MIFLKLGGSLITDKAKANTARLDVIDRIANEIAAFLQEQPETALLIGHGSGSFGHAAAAEFQTQLGADGRQQWAGFTDVWAAAQALNRLIVDGLRGAGIHALSLPPSASAVCQDGELVELAVEPIQRTLSAGVIPIVYGDVAVDRKRGATIVSTEQVLAFLVDTLQPGRILLAGNEAGVYGDYPIRQQLLDTLSLADLEAITLLGADSADVTGGMADKVRRALALVERWPSLEIRIFSGQEPGSIGSALRGQAFGTRILPT